MHKTFAKRARGIASGWMFCGCVLAVSSAHAQTAAPTPPETPPAETGGIQDIIVTAQKAASGQAAQKVPLAVTAVSAETIAATGALNLTDVAGSNRTIVRG